MVARYGSGVEADGANTTRNRSPLFTLDEKRTSNIRDLKTKNVKKKLDPSPTNKTVNLNQINQNSFLKKRSNSKNDYIKFFSTKGSVN